MGRVPPAQVRSHEHCTRDHESSTRELGWRLFACAWRSIGDSSGWLVCSRRVGKGHEGGRSGQLAVSAVGGAGGGGGVVAAAGAPLAGWVGGGAGDAVTVELLETASLARGPVGSYAITQNFGHGDLLRHGVTTRRPANGQEGMVNGFLPGNSHVREGMCEGQELLY